MSTSRREHGKQAFFNAFYAMSPGAQKEATALLNLKKRKRADVLDLSTDPFQDNGNVLIEIASPEAKRARYQEYQPEQGSVNLDAVETWDANMPDFMGNPANETQVHEEIHNDAVPSEEPAVEAPKPKPRKARGECSLIKAAAKQTLNESDFENAIKTRLAEKGIFRHARLTDLELTGKKKITATIELAFK